MTINITMAVTLAGLYSIGFYLLMQRSLMRVILGIVILGHGANLFLQVAGGPPGEPTFVGTALIEEMVDPLPQALALTAIVITFAMTTFLLALAYRSWALLGHDEVQDDVEDRRIAEAELAEQESEDETPDSERVAGFEAPEAPESRPGEDHEEARIR
ncbi:Na(+)/H(+) antiporter subunit C [Prauserella rugosa]|uniref:Multicomponent Na+:H+ antiporter subunit C n=1 Tax=Prauserella rugosa TaxID=43354 RepID=A0A660C8F7_9PSEU|nr:Na(+)/H(+) antiporter subunit C [Prauserella rugosa]KMS92607.1 sodium:proton antiporter [Streptomyces regensis]TWH19818.1 multicomponent Na+:H+ antiporter subunit C [Prauserella rugosa]